MKPDWDWSIKEPNPNFNLLANIRENSLASLFNKVMGLHPSKDKVSLFAFGINGNYPLPQGWRYGIIYRLNIKHS